jgi:N-formylglutamate amidohydrolase
MNSTPQWLTGRCVSLFENAGYKTAINKPFGGSLVPKKYYRSNKEVLSVMIEVNRKLYLENSAFMDEKFIKIKTIIENTLDSLQQGL